MKKIKYKKYAKHVEKRLGGYYSYEYYWKFDFMKSHDLTAVNLLFKRYLHDDIDINWDMK